MVYNKGTYYNDKFQHNINGILKQTVEWAFIVIKLVIKFLCIKIVFIKIVIKFVAEIPASIIFQYKFLV